MQRRPQMTRRPSVGGKNAHQIHHKAPAPKLARLQQAVQQRAAAKKPAR
jgi:hypothetical protein